MLKRFDLNLDERHNNYNYNKMQINRFHAHQQSVDLNEFDEPNHFQQEEFQKKEKYYESLKKSNQSLLLKIKQIDESLNNQMQNLSKKIVSNKKKSFVAKFDETEDFQLKERYSQLQKLKREIEMKKQGEISLSFLNNLKETYNGQVNKLNEQIGSLLIHKQKLEKIKVKASHLDQIVKKEVVKIGQFEIFDDKIEQLKAKIKQKKEIVKAKKNQFLNLYRINRSSRSIQVSVESSPKIPKIQEKDEDVLRLKKQYQLAGKRIEILKIKKAQFLKTTNECEEKKKILNSLKVKYQSILKLIPK